MTIKASYNTVGEKVFSFPDCLYSNGNYVKAVNNTDYKKIDANLPPFDENEIVIFEGNDGGYFLTVLHENDPIHVLESSDKIEDLHLYLNKEHENCKKFNYTLSTYIKHDDKILSYYLLNHTINYSNPVSPEFHYLLKKVNIVAHFDTLYACYESLYAKCDEYNNIVDNKSFPLFVCNDFINMLTADELSLFTFSIFCNVHDSILFPSWRKSFIPFLANLKTDAFAKFGIDDGVIDDLFKHLKMSSVYYFHKIHNNEGTPSVYYFDRSEGVKSYLKPEDELTIWRAGKKYQEYLTKNYDYVIDDNEPADRG